MDFLIEYQPQFDWHRRTLTFPPSAEAPEVPSSLEQLQAFGYRASIADEELAFLFDPDEEPDEVEVILKVVPKQYHDFLDVFSKLRAEKLPPHRSYDHSIELIDSQDLPPLGPIYSTSIPEAKALKAELDSLLAKGFIRPSQASFGAPVLFVKKPHSDELRMCIDYRQLNLRTKKNKYPLPSINFLLEQTAGAKIFTKIDLRGAYHLLRIAEGDEYKTTFRCRYGAFEFLVMPFGLTNAPPVFQHLINDVLRQHLDVFVVAYLDDILIYSADEAQHQEHVRTVLECLRSANLYAKASKCQFHVTSTEFLGYNIGVNGLGMCFDKVSAVLSWPTPTNVKGVQSFLGFANFYRRFIRGYSKVIAPLTNLTRKDRPFQWTSECQSAFDELKARFTSAPILMHFDPNAPTYLETDASDYAIGTILSQEGADGLTHPVAFDSRKFLPAELNYEIHDKELLAIVWAFKRWRSMLLSTTHTIKVLTDHQALTYFMTNKQLTRRQVRWAEFLADYDFVIEYRPGKHSDKPDALSRRDDVYPNGGDAHEKNPQNFMTLLKSQNVAGFLARVEPTGAPTDQKEESQDFISAIYNAQQADRTLRNLHRYIGDSNHEPKVTRRPDGILLIDGKVAVPDKDGIKLQILFQKHDHPTAGHPGIAKTLQLIRRDYYWPKAKADVADYVGSCTVCLRNKPVRQKPQGLLQPLPIPDRPWSSLSMDFIEKLPNASGYDCILVIVDRLTKMSVFLPTTVTATSRDLADLYITHVWSKHGTPNDIVSDRGSKFVSKFWKAVCKLLNIKQKLSTAYHPETDGQTERVNQTLEQYLRIYCAYQQDDWDKWLPIAEFAYNNSDHTSTKVSPFFANYGYHPSLSVEHGASATEPGSFYVYQLDSIHDFIKSTLKSAQERQKEFADNHRRDSPDFKVNDLVMLSTENLKLARPTRKFAERYIGPFRISERVSEVAFRLDLPRDLSALHPVFHVSLLRNVPTSGLEGRHVPPPGPIDLEENTYEVADIVDSRIHRKQLQYRVKWKGYENHQQEYTWEPAVNVAELTDLLDDFHSAYPDKPSPKSLKRLPTSPKIQRRHQ